MPAARVSLRSTPERSGLKTSSKLRSMLFVDTSGGEIWSIAQENNLTFQAFFSKLERSCSECRAIFLEVQALFSECRAIFLEVRPFFSECRAIFLELQPLFSECRAIFSELQALFSDGDPLSLATGAKRLKKSDLRGGTLRL